MVVKSHNKWRDIWNRRFDKIYYRDDDFVIGEDNCTNELECYKMEEDQQGGSWLIESRFNELPDSVINKMDSNTKQKIIKEKI